MYQENYTLKGCLIGLVYALLIIALNIAFFGGLIWVAVRILQTMGVL